MANSLGTITPSLILQRALETLTDSFPILGSFVQDFSDVPVLYNQTVYSRIPQLQAVQSWNQASGFQPSTGTLIDIPVTINNFNYTEVAFNQQELSSTNLNLIETFAKPLAYQIGNDITAAVFGLVTTGNYTSSVAIPSGQLATRNNAVVPARLALNQNLAPQNDRFYIANPTIESELLQDESVVKMTWGAGGIGENSIPPLHGFQMGTYTAMPTTANLKAVALQKDALVIASRPPSPLDLEGIPQVGLVQNVTDPRTGLTVQYVIFQDLAFGRIRVRYAWQYGVAVGNAKCLTRVTRVT